MLVSIKKWFSKLKWWLLVLSGVLVYIWHRTTERRAKERAVGEYLSEHGIRGEGTVPEDIYRLQRQAFLNLQKGSQEHAEHLAAIRARAIEVHTRVRRSPTALATEWNNVFPRNTDKTT